METTPVKLFYSPTSPFVRKVLVTAHELGVASAIELVPSRVGGVFGNAEIARVNPLGQVPTLVADDGSMIADSAVICEYLDAGAGGSLVPRGQERWSTLTRQAVADGLMEATVLWREEDASRPQELQWDAWRDHLRRKIESTLDFFALDAAGLEARTDIATIALACGLGYLDLRFSKQIDWRARCPGLGSWYEGFAQRPSMQATVAP